MLTYFTAKKAEQAFLEYRALAVNYWHALPPDPRTWMTRDVPRPESTESLQLRETIMRRCPEVTQYAQKMGISTTAYSHPPAAVGGPVIPINIFEAVVNQDSGWGHLDRGMIMDTLEKSIGTAQTLKKRLFRKSLNPIYWLIQAVAYILRIPFLILRAAGLPAKIEEQVWAQVVKGLILLALIGASIHFGIKITPADILSKLLGK